MGNIIYIKAVITRRYLYTLVVNCLINYIIKYTSFEQSSADRDIIQYT